MCASRLVALRNAEHDRNCLVSIAALTAVQARLETKPQRRGFCIVIPVWKPYCAGADDRLHSVMRRFATDPLMPPGGGVLRNLDRATRTNVFNNLERGKRLSCPIAGLADGRPRDFFCGREGFRQKNPLINSVNARNK